MVEVLAKAVDPTDAPPLVPVDQPIDHAHLSRMTLGERSLELEVLALFDRQTSMLLTRMKDAGPNTVAALAHTIKGSARGIGAWQVARAAEAVERAAARPEAELIAAVEGLSFAIDEARAVIADLLRAN